jgi:hypothetical protein
MTKPVMVGGCLEDFTAGEMASKAAARVLAQHLKARANLKASLMQPGKYCRASQKEFLK